VDVTVAEHPVDTAGPEVGDRGSLTVRDRAVDHVAEYAARGVAGVVSQHGRTVGRSLPRVDSNVTGGHVRMRIAIATAWPRSVAGVSAAVRTRVTDQVERCTGLIVEKVDVVVDNVVHGAGAAERRDLQ
jgi:uncharacterized alkaline shock family protein YloU